MDMALLLAGQLEMMRLIVPFLLGGDNIYLQKAGFCLQMGAGCGFRLPFGVGKMRQPENGLGLCGEYLRQPENELVLCG